MNKPNRSADVIQLDHVRSRETVDALRALLEMALLGKLKGAAICYQADDGFEESVFTGLYKARPAEGVNAAMRLAWKLTKAQDTRDE